MKKTVIMILAALMPLGAAAQQRTLTLEECLRLAGENDPYVKNARLDVLAAEAQRQEALAEWFPTVSATALGFHALNPLLRIGLNDVLGSSDAANNLKNQIYQTAPLYGIPTSYTALEYGYGATVSVTQPLFAGGRILNGNRLAALGVKAAQLQSDLKRKTTLDEIEAKYWRVVSLERKTVTLSEAQALLDTLLHDVQSARASGLVTDSDVLQVRMKRSELRSTAIQLKGGITLARMDLCNAVGLKFSSVRGAGDDPYIDDIVLVDSVEDALPPENYYVPEEELAARTEESRLLTLQVEAGDLERKMAIGEAMPTVGIGAMYGYGRYIGDGSTNGAVYAMVKIPISDWGKVSRKARRLAYQTEKARNERDYLDSQLVLRARQQWVAVNTAWEQMSVSRETVAYAHENFNRLESNYKAGLVTLSELLQAEVSLRQSKDDLVDSSIAYRTALNEYLEEK